MNHFFGPLRCFESHQASSLGLSVRVEGTVDSSRARFTYRIQDPREVITWNSAGAPAERKNDLWQATCFECFTQADHEKGYREWNVSPVGAWNQYSFSGYREGQREVASATPPAVSCFHDFSGVFFQWECDLDPSWQKAKRFRMGLCMVMALRSGERLHWSMNHADPSKADFHRCDQYPVFKRGQRDATWN